MPEGTATDVESADASPDAAFDESVSPLFAASGAVVAAALMGLCVYAGSIALAAAYLLGALVLAAGWPSLLGLARERSSAAVLALAAVSMAVIVGSVDGAAGRNGIRWVTAALAISLALVFLHALTRRGGRDRVVVSLAAMSMGLGALASGAFVADAALRQDGREAVVAALAGAAVGALLDAALSGRTRLAEWSLPASLLLGVAAGVLAAWVAGVPWSAPLVAGLIGAGVSHAFRAILAESAARTGSALGRLALGSGSVLFVGVIPTAAVWFFQQVS